jgi:hypothetical protein
MNLFCNIASIRQTCSASPSQWEGNLKDGRMLYIRYRWGHLSIKIIPKATSDILDAVKGISVFSQQWSDNVMDGEISYSEIEFIMKGIELNE